MDKLKIHTPYFEMNVIIYSTGKFGGECLNDFVQCLNNFHIILWMKNHIMVETQVTTTNSGVLIF